MVTKSILPTFEEIIKNLKKDPKTLEAILASFIFQRVWDKTLGFMSWSITPEECIKLWEIIKTSDSILTREVDEYLINAALDLNPEKYVEAADRIIEWAKETIKNGELDSAMLPIKIEDLRKGIFKWKYNIEGHYDLILEKYDEHEEYNPRKHILIKDQLTKTLGENFSGLSVLDLGCGSGFFSVLAKELGAEYVCGVDISQGQINLAKMKADHLGVDIDYKKGNIIDLQLDKKFDIVIAGFVFSYSENKEILKKEFHTAYNHLKQGGKLFAVVCNPENPTREEKILYRVTAMTKGDIKDGAKLLCEFYDIGGKRYTHDYKFYWSKQTIEDLLNETGFQDIKWINIKKPAKNQKIPILLSTNVILYANK